MVEPRADARALGRELAPRLADIAAAVERYASFAFFPDAEEARAALAADERRKSAHELVLRALRTAADPLNDRVLRRLAAGDASLGELAELVELPRLAVWERVNDLVQVGLVARELVGDAAGLTAAGRRLLALVDDAVDGVVEASA